MKPYIVAITGASGVIYGARLVQVLAEQSIPVELVISDTATIVAREEMGIDLAGAVPQKSVHLHDFKDLVF